MHTNARPEAGSLPYTRMTDAPLIDVPRLEEIASLLGEDFEPLFAESSASMGRNLDLLERVDATVEEFARASHAIASASLQLGLMRLGLEARGLEVRARALDAETRLCTARALRALADRSHAALRAHLEPRR